MKGSIVIELSQREAGALQAIIEHHLREQKLPNAELLGILSAIRRTDEHAMAAEKGTE